MINDTLQKIKETITERWNGGTRMVGLKNDVFTIGSFFDPHYSPSQEQLNEFANFDINYLNAICEMIKGQHPNVTGTELQTLLLTVRAHAHPLKLIRRLGMWGDEIKGHLLMFCCSS